MGCQAFLCPLAWDDRTGTVELLIFFPFLSYHFFKMLRRRQVTAVAKPPKIFAKVQTSSSQQSGGPKSYLQGLLLLMAVRAFSALFNIVHDCDEVYNYWEPLHFVIYGSGMQTWEYSSQYALRSFFYLILHALIVWPLILVVGNERGESVVQMPPLQGPARGALLRTQN
jgi:hypothetical protein